MKYYTRDLLTLLISLFVFASCENPSGIGLDIDPNDEIPRGLMDTITLHTVTELDDSARSVEYNQMIFGLFNDPLIGETKADLAFPIGRPSVVPRLSPEAEIDSVVLVLAYGPEYFGDSTGSSFPITVRRLNEVYTDGNYATKKWSVHDEVLGTTTVSRFRIRDSVSVRTRVDGKDTVLRAIPQMRITLSADFFKTLFAATVDSASLSTEVLFLNHTKGLYLSVDKPSASGTGGIVTFRGVPNVTGIEMTFRQPNGKTGEDAGIDTVRTFFPTTVTAQTSMGGSQTYPRLSSAVERVYTADVQEQLDNPTDSYETLYLQGGAGLRAKVNMPYIDELKGRDWIINKAELVVYVDEQSLNTTGAAPRLTLYREDIAGQRQPVPDGDSRTSGGGYAGDSRSLWQQAGGTWQFFGGGYQQNQRRYVFVLTSYMQDLILGKINNSDFYLTAAAVHDLYVPVVPYLNTGSRAVVGGGNPGQYKMKLNIYYSEGIN